MSVGAASGGGHTPHPVCPAAELPPGRRRIVTIDGKSIGVFNVGGRFFALRNRCPHRGAPLCEGQVVDLVTAKAPYVWENERFGEILRCPWHSWEFDLTTGRSVCYPETIRTKCYPAGVAGPTEHDRAEAYEAAERGGMVVVWV
jgi:3-phenylpropionate/trans-cinnamate dioxygenase ferredoxin subunit